MATSAAAALGRAQNAAPAIPLRRVYSLNRNWLFGGKMTPGADAPAFDDSKFQRVTLPHTNVELPWHSFDDKAYEFVSIYRRHFRAPAAWKGKRVFADFGGVMTASKVTVNGHHFEEYRGGYTPFSFELTPHLKFGADNLLAVEVDSTERPDIPPFGGSIDYLTFGGIYRDVELRVVPQTHLAGVFAKPVRVLANDRAVVVRCYLDGPVDKPIVITAELRDGDRVVKTASATVNAPAEYHDVTIENLGDIQLWDLGRPKLYQVTARLDNGDAYTTRDRIPGSAFHRQGFLSQRPAREAARPEPPPDVPLHRRRHAGAGAGARRPRAAQGTEVQHRAHLALSAIARLSGRLRRGGAAGAGRDPGLAAHRRPGVAVARPWTMSPA